MTASSAKADNNRDASRATRISRVVREISRGIVMLGLFSGLWSLLGCGSDEPGRGSGYEKLPDSRPPMRPAPSYEQIEKSLNSKVWSERSGAVLDVLRGKHRQALPILYRLLTKDPHPAVRQTAALALADFKEKRAVPVIARMLEKEKNISPDYVMRCSDWETRAAVAPWCPFWIRTITFIV